MLKVNSQQPAGIPILRKGQTFYNRDFMRYAKRVGDDKRLLVRAAEGLLEGEDRQDLFCGIREIYSIGCTGRSRVK